MNEIIVDAIGDACPLPVVKTRKAIKEMQGSGTVCVYVDNEIAVQNLSKMANQLGYGVESSQESQGKYQVRLTVGEGEQGKDDAVDESQFICETSNHKQKKVVVIAGDCMGEGDPALGKQLLKGFIFALTQLEVLPGTMLFYNGGAAMTCEGSPALEDLRTLAERGVEILTCGTCLNQYGITDKLAVGEVTNMYVIAEKQMTADCVIKP